MENPDAYRAGKDLIEFTWQQNHMNSCKCFSLKFYRENDMPLLTGRFLSRENGETRESGTDAFSNPVPWQLTWVQWFDLQNMLAESDLPEYRKPSLDARTRPTAKSGSFGAPMTGARPKSSAAAMQKRWKPWCWILPRKHMLRQSLSRSSMRCVKQRR